MITLKTEVAATLAQAASSLEQIGGRLPERAESACLETAAILAEAAREFTPPPPKYTDSARRIAGRMKPSGVKPTGIASE